ncbi:MAG: glycosyltransferase family 2 protein [Nitrospirae bacterium]|nr:glycosyltransferase family 2 protein [Nitrospirota bacterium]
MSSLNIIIVNWNTRELLKACLESTVRSLTLSDYMITVVDNCSHDGSAEMVKERFPKVNLIRNGSNLGFAKANNQAIEVSDSKFILLLNSDTVVTEGSVETMMEAMKKNQEIGILGPSLAYPDGRIQLSFYDDPTPARELYRAFFMEKLSNIRNRRRVEKKGPIYSDWIMGACMLIRREVIDAIGLLDDKVFMYYEDFDICLRARKAGWKVACLPEARIIHFENASGKKKFSTERETRSAQSLAYFYTKHYPPQKLFFLRTVRAVEALSRIFIFSIIYAFKRNEDHLCRVRSYYSLLKGFVLKNPAINDEDSSR